jgi:hypothetical protein
VFRRAWEHPRGRRASNVLLGVEQYEGQVQHDGEPVTVDQEEEGQECVDSGFGDDVGVEAVAEIDRVDVIAGAKRRMSASIRQNTYTKGRCLE